MTFVRNAWYVAGLSTEFAQDNVIGRTLLDERIVLYRRQDGMMAAIGGVCPHRFAPLEMGKRRGDAIECIYHGLQFDGSGKCIHNPRTGGALHRQLDVPGYEVCEKFGFVWVFMKGGEDSAPIPIPDDMSFLEELPAEDRGDAYLHMNADYRLIIDNLMDASHADFLHPELLATNGVLSQSPELIDDGHSIAGIYTADNKPVQALFGPFVPGGTADQHFLFQWFPPSLIRITARITVPGGETIFTDTMQILTPETAHSCHYWVSSVRNFALGGRAVTDQITNNVRDVFLHEDKPVLEAIDRIIGDRDFWKMRPALLEGDAPSALVRRRVAELATRSA
ncbi:aromatic ring-hydroxylating dioxygenase subunit alpha [Sphingobium sp. HBC34]|uniref:Aromatic ring-hydroxylating dioxygenase subunit alpha n=1 Tax=Sphingobium cyanobacteriorum TaxID=3063954 RepID=A0ABT8ZUA1_9SPHN|nr:aromatic ring-hydroxylating dioxygenase subunit alpha [Sphingobium sp. HBC34]MDO7837310.1 aromatic ring-hydroxylating dioxygenase subunit alpha [Sphingobium sp. HBC34]